MRLALRTIADKQKPQQERLRDVAAILADDVLRLRQRAALPTDDAQKSLAELPAASLEVPEETVLSVHTD